MKRFISIILTVVLLTAVPVLAVPSSVPTAELQFNGGIYDVRDSAEIITDFADYSGSESRRPQNDTLSFGEDENGSYMEWSSTAESGGGFNLAFADGLITDGSVYTIAIKFALNQTGSDGNRYRKILNFGGYSEDDGLYFLSGNLTFYYSHSSRGASEQSFTPGEVIDMLISRNDMGEFTVSVLQQETGEYETVYTWMDENGGAVLRNNTLGFFFDDNDGISGEAASGGRIYSLRLWNGAKPTAEPQETVTASPQPTDTTPNDANMTSFSSNVSEWAKQEVEEAYSEGLIPEVLVGTDLTQKVNRAEFASVSVALYERLSGNSALTGANPFTDIANSPCRDDIIKAYNLDITTGTDASTFDPYSSITREQVATMLCRTYKKSEFKDWSLEHDSEYPLNFMGTKLFADDEDISDYAKESVYFMAKWNIINGVDETHFAPKGNILLGDAYGYATREQAVIIALRTAKYLTVSSAN